MHWIDNKMPKKQNGKICGLSPPEGDKSKDGDEIWLVDTLFRLLTT